MATTKSNKISEARNPPKYLPWLLIIGSLIALVCAFIIMLEKIEVYKNPNYIPSCNINPIISCGSVMRSHQAQAFGFPNPLLGLIGFPAVATIGLVLLSGVRFKRWIWLKLNAGLLFAVGFVYWLIFETIYRIGALCPYCMVVWSVTFPMFWYTTLYNLQVGNIKTPTKLKGVVAFAQKHHFDVVVLWFVVVVALILKRFWYYWSAQI